MKNTPIRALILDDDPDFLAMLEKLLNSLKVETTGCTTYEQLHAALDSKPDVIFLDIMLPHIDGIQVIQRLADLHTDAPLVLVSGADTSVLEAASRYARLEGMRVAGTLQKPFRIQQLAALLESKIVVNEQQSNAKPSLNNDEVVAAINEDRLLVYYQPKVDYSENRLLGLEALARICSKEGHIILPDQFMPAMESTELMSSFAARILHIVLTDLVQFTKQGLVVNAAINVGINLLEKGGYPDVVRQACEKFGIPASNLTLEITERSITENVKAVLRVATRLRILGIGLSIDDFGTAFSSVERLRNLPFSELKIDRSLITEATESEQVRARCADIIKMGKQLQLKVVAEGVENEDELDVMTAVGCRYFQGFYFAHSMPAAEIPAWIADRENNMRPLRPPPMPGQTDLRSGL